MKTIKLYLDKDVRKNDSFISLWNESLIFNTIEIEEDLNIWDTLLKINNKHYYVCSGQDNNYSIKELEYYKGDNEIDELEECCDDCIKCPVCGYEESDCHEYSADEEDNHICGHCGSILSWNREYSVTYTTEVIKINKPIEIEY